MRKLKSKYKWANRESHFRVLEIHRKMWESFGYSFIYGLRANQERHTGGLLSVLQEKFGVIKAEQLTDWEFRYKEQWTDEELEKINGTCLADESALDKVSGTTNPESKSSYHSSDELERKL